MSPGHVDESAIGDVLLFQTDEGSACTRVCSAYSSKTYYTIASRDLETVIYRGNAKGTAFISSTHVATVSTATSGRNRFRDALWNLAGMMSNMAGPPEFQGETDTDASGLKKNVKEEVALTPEKALDDDRKGGRVSEKHSEESGTYASSDRSEHRLMAARTPTVGQDRMVFIRLGRDAFSRVGDCLKVDTSSCVAFSSPSPYN